jgi:4-amino-4-deoxy-L-arabinose transferase-like glycosyltransferase
MLKLKRWIGNVLIAAPGALDEANSASGPSYPARASILILISILSVSSVLYYMVLTPERFGRYHDDSIYATTAKALATGQGYRIISLPNEPAQIKYPPFYPILLSLIWRANPKFPENIVWMMMLSAIATLGFLVLTYRYLTNHGYASHWQALIIVGLAGINWRTMILATNIFAEMVYAALSLAALYLAEKYEAELNGWVRGLELGILIGLAFLTRSSGVALLVAVGLYYLLRRRWLKAVIVAGVGSLFILGWIGWCYANKANTELANSGYYGSYLRDVSGMVTGMQAEGGASKIEIILTILQQNFFSGIVVSIPIVCSGLNYESIPQLGEYGAVITTCSIFLFLILITFGFLRQVRKRFRLLHIYLVVYLALHLSVPYNSYDRYLLPLLPFLLLLLIMEMSAGITLVRRELGDVGQLTRKLSVTLIGLVITSITCIGLYSYGSGIKASISSLKGTDAKAAEDAEAVRWINAYSDPSEVLMCSREPVYYLYTGRKAVPLTIVKSGGSGPIDPSLLFTPISNFKAKYLVLTSTDFDHDYETESQQAALRTLVDQYPKRFILLFESADHQVKIYLVDNDPAWSPIG